MKQHQKCINETSEENLFVYDNPGYFSIAEQLCKCSIYTIRAIVQVYLRKYCCTIKIVFLYYEW